MPRDSCAGSECRGPLRRSRRSCRGEPAAASHRESTLLWPDCSRPRPARQPRRSPTLSGIVCLVLWNAEAETLPRERLAALQLERLQHTLGWQLQSVPVMRQHLHDAGVRAAEDITSLDDLGRLPFTRKTDLREHYPFGLFAVPREQVVRIHASSGTRGKPTVVGYTRNDLAVWSEVMARTLMMAGVRPGMVVHNAYGYGLFTGGLGLHLGPAVPGLTGAH